MQTKYLFFIFPSVGRGRPYFIECADNSILTSSQLIFLDCVQNNASGSLQEFTLKNLSNQIICHVCFCSRRVATNVAWEISEERESWWEEREIWEKIISQNKDACIPKQICVIIQNNTVIRPRGRCGALLLIFRRQMALARACAALSRSSAKRFAER